MSPIKNVIFIMLDTLQFNYLGCYGNTKVKTPNLDRFARQGFLFENAYSEGLPTIPVRRAIMTGRFTLPYAGWCHIIIIFPLNMPKATRRAFKSYYEKGWNLCPN